MFNWGSYQFNYVIFSMKDATNFAHNSKIEVWKIIFHVTIWFTLDIYYA